MSTEDLLATIVAEATEHYGEDVGSLVEDGTEVIETTGETVEDGFDFSPEVVFAMAQACSGNKAPIQ